MTSGHRLATGSGLGRLRFIALAALGSLVVHDAVFAAQYGLGPAREDALAATAHGYWPAFVAVTLLASVAGVGAAVRGVLHLRRLVRSLSAGSRAADRPGYPAEVARLWPRLVLVVGLAFLTQENVEHLAAGQALPGLWALSGPDYPFAIPVIIGVTGLLAVVGGLLQWHRETLVRRLAAARSTTARHRAAARTPHDRWALLAALLAHRWILRRRDAERAPPALATA